MSSDGSERRRFQRVSLARALPCQIADVGGFVFNISKTGALVAHELREGNGPEGEVKLSWDWEGRRLSFIVQVVHTDLKRRESRHGVKEILNIGVLFVRPLGASDEILKEIIAQHVERALDEQKANARGIPALAPSSIQTGSGKKGYVICRFRLGNWTRTDSLVADQPHDGFAIAAAESDQLDLLCKSYEEADQGGREMIRKMAEISIADSMGIPTRRYDP